MITAQFLPNLIVKQRLRLTDFFAEKLFPNCRVFQIRFAVKLQPYKATVVVE